MSHGNLEVLEGVQVFNARKQGALAPHAWSELANRHQSTIDEASQTRVSQYDFSLRLLVPGIFQRPSTSLWEYVKWTHKRGLTP